MTSKGGGGLRFVTMCDMGGGGGLKIAKSRVTYYVNAPLGGCFQDLICSYIIAY